MERKAIFCLSEMLVKDKGHRGRKQVDQLAKQVVRLIIESLKKSMIRLRIAVRSKRWWTKDLGRASFKQYR